MVDDDGQRRKRRGEIAELVELRVIDLRVERQPTTGEHGDTFPERAVPQQPWWRRVVRVVQPRVGIPRRDVPDAAEAVTTGAQVCVEHRFDAATEREIGLANDRAAHARV